MRKQHLVRMGLLTLLVIASFVLIHSTTLKPATPESCCCKKPRPAQEPGMIWELLPRQFFSSLSIH